MQETVETVEVDECTVIGDVLDLAATCVAWLDFVKQRTALLHALLFDELAARNDDVLTVEVDLDDLKVICLTDILIEVLRRLNVDLRRRHKGINANADDETALNHGADATLNYRSFFTVFDDFLPVLLLLCFVEGDNRVAFFIFEFFEKDF